MSSNQELITFIRSSKAGRLAIFCVGNILRSDDGIGPSIYQKLKNRIRDDILLINVEQSLENFLPLLNKENITHCLIIDAISINEQDIPAGTIGFFNPSDISNKQVSLSTHLIPMIYLVKTMEKESGVLIRILGIQPRSLEYDVGLSTEVMIAQDKLIKFLVPILQKSF